MLQDDYTVVASRLSPSDFGLVAFAGPPFANMGISSAVVQKPEFGNRDVRVGFAGSIAAELLVSTVVILKAPAIDVLFAQHEVVPVLRMLTLSFAIMSFGRSRLRCCSVIRSSASSRSSTSCRTRPGLPVDQVVARLEGAGVRSLVKATLTQAVTMVCPSYALTRACRSTADRWPTGQPDLWLRRSRVGERSPQPGDFRDRPPPVPHRYRGYDPADARVRPTAGR